MTNKTGVRMIPTFLVLAVAGIIWVVASNLMAVPKKDPPEREVLVSVAFDPVQRSGEPLGPGRNLRDVVTIQLTVGTLFHPTERVTKSSWDRVLHPRRGERILLRAEQFAGNRISCSVVQVGARPVQDTRPGPATISCIHTVT